MKVKELIELLQKEDKEAEVFFSHFDGGYSDDTGMDVDLEVGSVHSNKREKGIVRNKQY